MAILLGLLVAVLSIHCSCGVLPRHFNTNYNAADNISIDPDVLQYLTQLFENLKRSGRQPVDEELNLLPDESKGFANVVRCFPDSELVAPLSHTSNNVLDNQRIMRFDLHGFKSTEEIVEVRLVLKQSANTPEYTASLHEIMNDGGELKELDSHIYRGEWLDLNVHKVNDDAPKMDQGENNNRKSYVLALKISDLNVNWNRTATLNNVKPMLLVYVNNKNMLLMGDNTTKVSSNTKASAEEETNYTVKKRQADNTVINAPDPYTQPTEESESNTENRFEEMRKKSCRLYYINTTHEELRWPEHKGVTVIEPTSLKFAYCYGHCTQPFTRAEGHKYTRHAKIVSFLNPELSAAGLAPCCVPVDTEPYDIIFEEDGVTSMGTFPIVTSCGCR